MASIAEQLTDLKARQQEMDNDREAKDAAIKEAARDLQMGREELDELTARKRELDAQVEATAHLQADLQGAAKAHAEACDLAAADLVRIRAEHASLTSRIELELSSERRTALTGAIDAIDQEIEAAAAAAKAADATLGAAQQAVADARQASANAVSTHQDALVRLQALPQPIDGARTRVAAVQDAATRAVDGGRMAEAFVRARELGAALKILEAATSKDDKQLAADLPDLWNNTLTAAKELGAATAALGRAQADAAAARLPYEALLGSRPDRITEALSRTPESTKPAATPASATP